jgi:ribonuclease BN (tRNA processing enzyme)
MRLEIVGLRVGAPLGAPCSSYAVGGPDGMVLLDCGPGALEALWRTELIDRLGALVVSHMHLDHMLDLVRGRRRSRARAWPTGSGRRRGCPSTSRASAGRACSTTSGRHSATASSA